MVLSSGCCVLIQANSDLYMSNSLGTLRNAHSEILASPPLAATSAMIGNCNPVSEASPAFFCRMPNSDSATFEQVGPTATNASVEAMRRTTEMPSSALQRSSRNSIANLALLPSPSVTPPALLITSAAGFSAAGLQRALAVDAEDAHDAGLGAEAGDLDGALLRGSRRRTGERKRPERSQ